MANIYKVRIEAEIGLPTEAQRDALAQKVLTARDALLDKLPTGSQISVALVSQWDELEVTQIVVQRVNKQVI